MNVITEEGDVSGEIGMVNAIFYKIKKGHNQTF